MVLKIPDDHHVATEALCPPTLGHYDIATGFNNKQGKMGLTMLRELYLHRMIMQRFYI